MSPAAHPSSPDPARFQYVVGIDIGSQSCSFCTLKPDKSTVIKPTTFANTAEGFEVLFERLERLGVAPEQVLIGLEATSRDAGESLPRPVEPGLPPVEARIRGKPITLPNNAACGLKQISWMRPPWPASC